MQGVDNIESVIKKSYERTEEKLLEFAKKAFDIGYPQTAYVGTCALVAIIVNNKLYVAN